MLDKVLYKDCSTSLPYQIKCISFTIYMYYNFPLFNMLSFYYMYALSNTFIMG